ncbi:hypothetical protein [Actinoplanes sp. NPDC023714]|uniref:hypothetical protein n=1 Tax=Actinoplanes sp. NPDC023714 TaxID=3154322 RepID=UPI0033E127F8
MRFVLVAAIVTATLAGCGGGDGKPEAPASSAPAPSVPERLDMSAYGPYRIGQTQAELEASQMVRGLQPDETGCVSGTGSREMLNPRLRFAGGRLVQIELTSSGASTDTGLVVGAEVDQARTSYPNGKIIFGTAGAAWVTADAGNALLVRVTGDNVSGLVAGVATSVEQRHRTGMGC